MQFVIDHLVKGFEKKQVLRDIDFAFDSGKIYGLLGGETVRGRPPCSTASTGTSSRIRAAFTCLRMASAVASLPRMSAMCSPRPRCRNF